MNSDRGIVIVCGDHYSNNVVFKSLTHDTSISLMNCLDKHIRIAFLETSIALQNYVMDDITDLPNKQDYGFYRKFEKRKR